jgi:hypothetical protein
MEKLYLKCLKAFTGKRLLHKCEIHRTMKLEFTIMRVRGNWLLAHLALF